MKSKWHRKKQGKQMAAPKAREANGSAKARDKLANSLEQ
jgi:hypothetical protein